jgi:two-component system, chemotaxis family, CheB/CheR fusion protein
MPRSRHRRVCRGLAAFEAFFSGMPADTDPGMAFVLVQHLAPDHKSILTELVKRYTRMKVFEVADGMAVKPNCAYIIPPNRDMALLNGTLQLLGPAAPRGHRLPIDFFPLPGPGPARAGHRYLTLGDRQ